MTLPNPYPLDAPYPPYRSSPTRAYAFAPILAALWIVLILLIFPSGVKVWIDCGQQEHQVKHALKHGGGYELYCAKNPPIPAAPAMRLQGSLPNYANGLR